MRSISIAKRFIFLSSRHATVPQLGYFSRTPQLCSRPPNTYTRLRIQTGSHTQWHRHYASQTTADEKVEEIQDLYATAKDEFEMAAEETEKMTVYAEDDRAAAREELTKLQEAYHAVIDGQDVQLAEEVRRRVGQRIRELESAVKAMEEMAMNQD